MTKVQVLLGIRLDLTGVDQQLSIDQGRQETLFWPGSQVTPARPSKFVYPLKQRWMLAPQLLKRLTWTAYGDVIGAHLLHLHGAMGQ